MNKALIGGTLAALALHLFYRAVALEWPGAYSSLRRAVDSFATRSLAAYGAFRVTPAYLVGVFLGVTLDRLGAETTVGLTCMTVIHLVVTNGRAVVDVLLNSRSSTRRLVLIGYHVVTITVVVGAVWLSAITRSAWAGLIPRPEDISTSIWTGVIAAILAVLAQRAQQHQVETGALVERARRDVGADLWQYIEQASFAARTDALLMKAVVSAEALQRPSWIRKLERLKGRLIPPGTYGVAQVSSSRTIDDRESINELCRRFTDYYPPQSRWDVDSARLAARLEEHNADSSFIDLVLDLYRELLPRPRAATEQRGPDSRPLVEVHAVRRAGRTWRISGTACVPGAGLVFTTTTLDGHVARQDVTASSAAPRRGAWTVDLPIEVDEVHIASSEEGGIGASVPMVHLIVTELAWD